MDIYVGNLPYSATEEDLTELFTPFGPVKRTTIIKDRETGRSKGFGFVSLSDESKVDAAVAAVHGRELGGRILKANPSEPRQGSQPGGGGPNRQTGPGRQERKDGGSQHWDNEPEGGMRQKGHRKSKGSQKGKRRQKGGYDEEW